MQKLVQGFQQFQQSVFRSKRDLFKKLSKGQRPSALFVTCADSRINPNLITQTEPGEIFVLRNAGNIIPPAPARGGEIATIEFAIEGLNIQDIVVCGHSDCGAMKALLDPGDVATKMPAVNEWLNHARSAVGAMEASRGSIVEENVLLQIENLRTHRAIEDRLQSGELRLHGWVYHFEAGQIHAYDAGTSQFLPLADKDPRPVYPRDLCEEAPLPLLRGAL